MTQQLKVLSVLLEDQFSSQHAIRGLTVACNSSYREFNTSGLYSNCIHVAGTDRNTHI